MKQAKHLIPDDFYEQYGLEWLDPLRRDVTRLVSSHKISTLCDLLQDFKIDSVLDFGCGEGADLSLLGRELKIFKRIGVDISSTMLSIAREEHRDCQFVLGSIDYFEQLGPREIDLVMFLDVLEHLEDPAEALRKAKPKANYIAVSVPLEKTWLVDLLQELHVIPRRSFAYCIDGHLHQFSEDSFTQMVEECGLKVVEKRISGMPREALLHPFWLARRKKMRGPVVRVSWLLLSIAYRLPYPIAKMLLRLKYGPEIFVICRT